MPKGARSCLRERADRDPRGSLARRRALEDVADIFEVVLQHPRQVRMSGPRTRHRLGLAAIARVGRHPLLPIFVVAILDDEGDRTAHAASEADAGNRPHLVFFNQHPAAAAVAFLPAREVGVDFRDIDLETGRHAFDHGDQFGAVRFTGG